MEEDLDLEKLEELRNKACKDKVYIDASMGSPDKGFSSISLSISINNSLSSLKPRLTLASIPTSVYQSEEDKYTGKTLSWYSVVQTARSDAELLAYLWNHKEELIRLAQIGERAEDVGVDAYGEDA